MAAPEEQALVINSCSRDEAERITARLRDAVVGAEPAFPDEHLPI